MNNFTEEQFKVASALRGSITEGDIDELKAVYMAGEVCMWFELRGRPELVRSEKIDLLQKYTTFLQKQGYLDSDATSEEPFAIDEFLSSAENRSDEHGL